MRMLVLGAGLQGSACAYDLLRQPNVDRVTLADLKPGRVAPFVKQAGGGKGRGGGGGGPASASR